MPWQKVGAGNQVRGECRDIPNVRVRPLFARRVVCVLAKLKVQPVARHLSIVLLDRRSP